MFGKRTSSALRAVPPRAAEAAPRDADAAPGPQRPVSVPPPTAAKPAAPELSNRLHDIKIGIFNALLDAVDLKELAKLPQDAVREELTDIISEIVNIKK